MRKIIISLLIFLIGNNCMANDPSIGGTWVELRNSPLFESSTEKLAPTWGPTIPQGTDFIIEKIFGRWIYGKPVPLKNMLKRDYAPTGWVYSRMLLLPGDADTASKAQRKESFLATHYSHDAWKKLGLNLSDNALLSFDFLESLVLSQKTMAAFIHFDEQENSLAPTLPEWESMAYAANDLSKDEFGLVGANLDFLKQEFKTQQNIHRAQALKRMKTILQAPKIPAITSRVKAEVLGRYMINKYFTLPKLTHDEVDGFVYMKAIALRTLQGCSKKIQDHWKNRHWNILRVFQLKSHLEEQSPWLQLEMPGGYFPISARAIDGASNEAELAFLLIRPLVRSVSIPLPTIHFGKKWPGELAPISEEQWLHVLSNQSTLDSDNVDVSDEILVDQAAAECVSRAGYASGAPLSELKKLSINKDQSWAHWLSENIIGIDYRVERMGSFMPDALAKQNFPEGHVVNKRRFSQAAKGWNILP